MGLTLELDGPPPEAGLWEEHEAAWRAWCAVSGQWRTAALSGDWGAKVLYLGLDYAAAAAALTLSGVAVTPECWTEVRTIEEGAIEELNRNGR